MRIDAQNFAATGQGHQPFPVADFKQGLFFAKEPWMSPQNAFRAMENAHVFRGQVKKRSGLTPFAELAVGTALVRVARTSVAAPYVHYRTTGGATDRPIEESVSFDDISGAGGIKIYAQLANRRWSLVNPETSAALPCWLWDVVDSTDITIIIGYAFLDPALSTSTANRWKARLNWSLHSLYHSGGTGGYVDYWPNTESEVVGLLKFKSKANSEYMIAADADYVYRYSTSDKFYKMQGFGAAGFAGPFTGSSTDYFHFCQVDDYVLMTNNVDPVCKWDPTLVAADSVLEVPSDWTTPGSNALLTCLLVVRFAGRICYLNVNEVTTGRHTTRLRYTSAGSNTAFDGPGCYTDAPLDLGAIVTAAFIGERLFVGFDLGWMELVRRPGDSVAPFEWRPFISRFGAVSKLSTIPDSERLLSRSTTSMQSVDPNGQLYLDLDIPDLLLDFSADLAGLSVGARVELDRSFWWTYVKAEGTRPDGVLCATYDEKNQLSWSLYSIRTNVFSNVNSPDDLTWSSFGAKTWNELSNISFNIARGGVKGLNQMLGGYKSGMVYVFDATAIDHYITGPETITMHLDSQKWIPFPGQKSHFGWLDIFAEITTTTTFRLSFYGDEQTGPYLTTDFTMALTAGSEKAYTRIPVGRTAQIHRVEMTSLDDNAFALDAFVPWFRPAGRVRGF